MHGSIFVFFKRFIEARYDFNTWEEVVKKAKTKKITYGMYKVYPDRHIHRLIQAASGITQLPTSKLLEKFGEELVPHLLLIYNQYINPKWKTLDMLQNAEYVMHKAVEIRDPRISPPILNATRVDTHKLILDYYSKRKMGSLAIGIIKGIAKYYREETNIMIESAPGLESERVQIQVSYVD